MQVKSRQGWRARFFPNGEWVLLLVVIVECAVFTVSGTRFATSDNAFEISRLAVEIGLLALAMTPIIITGGIDLSVGSMMGLAAVVMGMLWRDAGLPLAFAILIALSVGAAGGALNALMIARFSFPPLIVTLGTFSLFRGIAEGLTRGIENYSGFPPGFLALGQGYVAGGIPTQMLLFVPAALAFGIWIQRSVQGRAFQAIGLSPAGARYAGIDVSRRIASTYIVSGIVSSLAAIIYVAHLGQAKSDAGTGYELSAISAVVLGGASIFGGRGTIVGTLLGLFGIVILQNGLRLSDQPAELTGILTGGLLIVTIAIDRITRSVRARTPDSTTEDTENDVRNSQVAALGAVIIAGSLIVAVSNWALVRSMRNEQHGSAPSSSGAPAADVTAKHVVVAMMPKAKGDPYFVSAREGAEAGAKELGVELLWDGPTELDPAKQNEVVEAWITRGVDAIAVSVENKVAISTVLRKARSKGIKVITWDADAERDARDFLVNQATPQGIGYTLTDEAAKVMHGKGEFAIITASLSAANQNEWMKYIRERMTQKYPEMKLVAVQPSDGDRDRAFSETQTVMKVHPNVKLIMGIAAPAVPGAAEAVKQSGRTDVKVVGLSLPNMCRPYIKSGIIESIVLWNTIDLGYLTVDAADALVRGQLKAGSHELRAGRLGNIEIVGDEIRLGLPYVFNKSNIDKFNF